MKKEKLVLPVSIVIGCIILGSFIYSSQTRQKQMEVQYKENYEYQLNQQISQKQQDDDKKAQMLDTCLSNAQSYFDNDMYQDIQKYGDQVVGAGIGRQELEILKNAQDTCLKQYK